jgi:hypothetical protein
VQFDNQVVYVITEGSRSSESASSASVQKQESWILPKIAEIESGRKLYTQFAPPTEFALDLSYEKKGRGYRNRMLLLILFSLLGS